MVDVCGDGLFDFVLLNEDIILSRQIICVLVSRRILNLLILKFIQNFPVYLVML
jgi:hypothetical protein